MALKWYKNKIKYKPLKLRSPLIVLSIFTLCEQQEIKDTLYSLTY